MKDRITISLYGKEAEDPLDPIGYNSKFLEGEFDNIKKIRDGFVMAAEEAKRTPPEIIVSVLLVPAWGRANNSYDDEIYTPRKTAYLEKAKLLFEYNGDNEGIENVKVQDFYNDGLLSSSEKSYMQNLCAMGSNADMIKTRAIINNLDRRHLQLDTNTLIIGYKELYDNTFNAIMQKDGINASYYDDRYISAHNKMIYTTPSGKIAKEGRLEFLLVKWCHEHKDIDADKDSKKNSIYSKVFAAALSEIGYTKKATIPPSKTEFHPATLSPEVYWLTKNMVTALNMTWSDEAKDLNPDNLKALSPIKVTNDCLFNFQGFCNVIKKHTGSLKHHSEMLKMNDSTGAESRKRLLDLSWPLEKNAVKSFYENAVSESPKEAFNLSKIFPPTPLGDSLTKDLFNVTVLELRQRAKELSLAAAAKSNVPIDSLEAKNVVNEIYSLHQEDAEFKPQQNTVLQENEITHFKFDYQDEENELSDGAESKLDEEAIFLAELKAVINDYHEKYSPDNLFKSNTANVISENLIRQNVSEQTEQTEQTEQQSSEAVIQVRRP